MVSRARVRLISVSRYMNTNGRRRVARASSNLQTHRALFNIYNNNSSNITVMIIMLLLPLRIEEPITSRIRPVLYASSQCSADPQPYLQVRKRVLSVEYRHAYLQCNTNANHLPSERRRDRSQEDYRRAITMMIVKRTWRRDQARTVGQGTIQTCLVGNARQGTGWIVFPRNR